MKKFIFILCLLCTLSPAFSQKILHPINSTPIVGTGVLKIPNQSKVITWFQKSYSIWDIDSEEMIKEFHVPFCITTLDISNDGNKLLTTCAELLSDDRLDSSVRVIDIHSGNVLQVLSGHKNGSTVRSANYSKDNSTIFSQSTDGTSKVWDAATGNLLVTIPDVNYVSNGLTISPDGRKILTTGNGTVRVWNTNTGALIYTIKGINEVTSLPVFSHKGDKILCTDTSNRVILCNAENGELIRQFTGHSLRSYSAHFSNDDSRIVTSSIDSTSIIFNTETGERVFTLKSIPLTNAKFNEDGTYVLTTNEHSVTLWNALTGEKIRELRSFPFRLHTFSFYDRNTLLLSGYDGTIELYNASSGDLKQTMVGMSVPRKAEFGTNNKHIVTLDNNCVVKIWDAQNFKPLRVLMNADDIEQFIYNHNSNTIITKQGIYSATIWDATTGGLIAKLKMGDHSPNSFEFDSSGSFFTTSGADNTAIMWDVKTFKQVHRFNGHTGSVLSASFNNKGSRLLTTSSDGTAKLWNTQTGKEITTIFKTYKAQFSHTNNSIIVVHWDKIPRLWNSENGELITEYSTPIKGYDGFRINAEATKYLYFPKYNVCDVVNLVTGEDICTVTLPKNIFFHSAYYDNINKRIFTYSASSDSVFIWDESTGNAIAVLQGHVRPITSIATDVSGNTILTCSIDGTVKKWSLEESESDDKRIDFSLTPNPADNELSITKPNSVTEPVNFTVFDLLGKRVTQGIIPREQKEILLSTKSLSIGVYHCVLEYSGNTAIKKFIISR